MLEGENTFSNDGPPRASGEDEIQSPAHDGIPPGVYDVLVKHFAWRREVFRTHRSPQVIALVTPGKLATRTFSCFFVKATSGAVAENWGIEMIVTTSPLWGAKTSTNSLSSEKDTIISGRAGRTPSRATAAQDAVRLRSCRLPGHSTVGILLLEETGKLKIGLVGLSTRCTEPEFRDPKN